MGPFSTFFLRGLKYLSEKIKLFKKSILLWKRLLFNGIMEFFFRSFVHMISRMSYKFLKGKEKNPV